MQLRRTAFSFFRFCVGTLFFVAGVLKGMALRAFGHEISQYGLLPSPAVPIAAVIIVALEIGCGMALIVGKGTRRSAWILFALVTLFMIALASGIVRGIAGDCGCFGGSFADPIGPRALIRDAVLLFFCLILATREKGSLAGDQ